MLLDPSLDVFASIAAQQSSIGCELFAEWRAEMERLVETLAPEAELTDLDEATADFLRFRLQRFTEIK